ncbi:MAG: hypothetical protein R2863_12055 [Candidatus Kapaibacterium sp.]
MALVKIVHTTIIIQYGNNNEKKFINYNYMEFKMGKEMSERKMLKEIEQDLMGKLEAKLYPKTLYESQTNEKEEDYYKNSPLSKMETLEPDAGYDKLHVNSENEIEFLIGVIEGDKGNGFQVINSPLIQFYKKESSYAGGKILRVTNLKGSMKDNISLIIAKTIFEEVCKINNLIDDSQFSFRVYLIKNQNNSNVKNYEKRLWIHLLILKLMTNSRLNISIGILKESFAPILGTSDGIYLDKSDQKNNVERADNIYNSLKKDSTNMEEIIDYLKKEDYSLYEEMINKPRINEFLARHGLQLEVSGEVKNLSEVALNTNHRM